MKQILYESSDSCHMALLEAIEIQASHPTMFMAEEGLPPSKIEKNKFV